jgi:hypothetical protein
MLTERVLARITYLPEFYLKKYKAMELLSAN